MWWMAVAAATAGDPSGRWVITSADSELVTLHAAAVEEGLSKLPWGFRPFARTQLTAAVKNCHRLELGATATTLTATCDGDRDHAFATAAPTPVTGGDGKPYVGTLSSEGGVWTLVISGEDGGQRVVYDRRDDGTLRVTKEIFSEWMTEPFHWTVSYRAE